MKNYIILLYAAASGLFFQNCSAQKSSDSQEIASLINAEEFTFHAERANPTNYDVINVMTSLPNAPMTRMLQLDGEGYGIELKKGHMEVVLPYFGRVFNPSYGNTNQNSYRFTSKNYTITKSQNKKGKWTFKIKPADVRNVSDINIEVFKNGKAFTSIKSNDRQPITYDGYISGNETVKETEKP